MTRTIRPFLPALVVVAVALGIGLYFRDFRSSTAQDDRRPIKLRLSSFALNLNPLALSDTESRRVATLLHLGLVRVAADGTVLPGVAAEWKQDAGTTTFKIKPGTAFNDGSPISVAEIKNSLCRSMQPGALFNWSLASIRHTSSADGKSIDCDGIVVREATGEVILTEATPKRWLLEALAGPGGWITKGGVQPGQHGNVPGAGPYVVETVVQDASVTLRARDGGPLAPASRTVTFTLIPDDTQAATALKTGQLDILEVTNPTLAKLVGVDRPDQLKEFVIQGVLSDRMRVLIVNRRALASKGLSAAQASTLMQSLDHDFKREDFVAAPPLLAMAASSPFPFPTPQRAGDSISADAVSNLPSVALSVLTESDAYSDLIASRIPKAIGAARFDYRGIDKGLLIDRMVNGDFDVASVAIEGTLRAPEFWLSFFQPGSPFTAFGESLQQLKDVPLDSEDGRAQALRTAANEGNWIGLLRERNVIVSAKGVTGLRFTPSGQASFESIGRQ